ncbi:MAG TPA: CYTH domain-containing protein [Oleiagrimonas sp.]|nr:CYTH domain-containing protein [Oleiagrimonas sp.]
MSIEIERKFLVTGEGWRTMASASMRMEQGYLVDVAALTQGLARSSVRVRIAGDAAWLNVKQAKAGIERLEFEYAVPLADAEIMLRELCNGRVEKIRHLVVIEGHAFEVDEFLGRNAGLVVAELELPSADTPFPRPAWLGADVSHLERYYNVNLIAHAYSQWSPAERAGESD